MQRRLTAAQKQHAQREYDRIIGSVTKVMEATGRDEEGSLLLLARAEQVKGVNATEDLKVKTAILLGTPERN